MSSLLELNAKILFNETILLANIICKNITVSGQPIKITGSDPKIISLPVPNPQAGIINTRYMNQTFISKVINDSQSQFDSIIKTKKKKSIKTNGNGSTKTTPQTKKIITKLKLEKNKIIMGRSNGDKLKQIYFKELINTTASFIIKQNLHTQIKLPSNILKMYANTINKRLIYSKENYGYYDLNLLIIQSILKIINF